MILEYNSFNLAALGDLSITQAREFEGGDAPQRCKVTLRVRVDLFERNYDDNYQLILQAREALRTGQALLRWHNPAVAQDYVNQTAALASDDLPEEWGQYHQTINLVFTFLEQSTITQNTPLTLQKGEGQPVYQLDHVTQWKETASVDRFDPKRPHRRQTQVRLVVAGLILGDPKMTLAARRTALQVKATAYRLALNGADTTLTFGGWFGRTVQVESFEADVTQDANALRYTFTAGYILFPGENYATAEFTAEQKDGQTGELFLSLSGKVQASTEAAARTKLDGLVGAARSAYGYGADSQLLTFDTTPNGISANSDGDTFTELSFTVTYRTWRATNQNASFKRTGSEGPAISLGHVRVWTDVYGASRFNPQRSQRSQATGRVEASGTWNCDPALPLAQRRAALLTQQRAMKAEVNCADGELVYGDWTQVCRVENLKAEVNQAETGVEWSFSAEYSLFPNESAYATAEFTVTQRADVESGDRHLLFAGRIMAPNGSLARAKLASLRTTLLGIYGYTIEQRLRDETQAAAVDANGDATAGIAEGIEAASANGLSLTELTFNEEYRARITGTLVSSNWTVAAATDVTTGLQQTVYSGSVTAAGATPDGAYATALARAQAIGAGKESAVGGSAMLLRVQIAQDRRQTPGTNAEEFTRLSFSYEYVSKIATGSAYLEVSTQASRDTFGMDVENVSGYVVAVDAATAATLYASEVRTAYNGQLVRNETTTQGRVKKQTGPSAFTTHETRLDFAFQVFVPKAAGKVAMRYSITTARDLLALQTRTSIRGSCFADTPAHARAVVTAFFAGYGSAVSTEDTEDHEWTATATYSPGAAFTAALAGFIKLDFSNDYRGRVTGDNALLEMRVSQAVRYSGTRWALHPLPYDTYLAGVGTGGITIAQPAGVQEGSRTIRGSVTSAELAGALAWARQHKSLLTGDDSGTYRPQPDEEEVEYEFVPRVDGIMDASLGGTVNVQVYRVSFTYAEILPNFPPP